jgi:hypothetical protein
MKQVNRGFSQAVVDELKPKRITMEQNKISNKKFSQKNKEFTSSYRSFAN